MPSCVGFQLKTFTGLCFAGLVLAIVANGITNWSHQSIPLVSESSTVLNLKWSPWTACTSALQIGKTKVLNSTCSHVSKTVKLPGLPFEVLVKMTDAQWTDVEATRAFTILSILLAAGATALGAVSALANLPKILQAVSYHLAGAASFCGFISMAVWASYSNKNEHEYGACFIVIIVSWMLLAVAAAVGFWEYRSGVPESVTRVFSVLGAATIFVLLIVATALADWSHGQYIVFSSLLLPLNLKFKGGLFRMCVSKANLTSTTQTVCGSVSSALKLEQGAHLTHAPIDIPASAVSTINAAAAFMILAILVALVAVLGAVVVYYKSHDATSPLARFRVPAMSVAVVFSFMAMCLWAAANRRTVDEEYGTGFAINCTAWALGLVWVLGNLFGGSASGGPTATDAKASGFGYTVSVGQGQGYSDI